MVASIPQFDSPVCSNSPFPCLRSSSPVQLRLLLDPKHPSFSPSSLILGSAPLQLSYVLAFDGFPRFLDTGVVQSDRSLIAAFCGQRRDRPLTVQALSGMEIREVGSLSWAVCIPCSPASC